MGAKRENEDELLRSVALQNANSILVARQAAERELIVAKEALEQTTRELAQSLSILRATLESTTDAILVTDDRRKVAGFNEKFIEMWGISKEAMIAADHQTLIAMIAPQVADATKFRARLDEIDAASPAESFDLVELADGRSFERFSKLQFVDGKNVGRVWCLRDVTERKCAEEERQVLLDRTEAARRDAENANRAKDEFLAVVSHELRTPLNAISGWSRLLLAGDLSPDKRQHAIEVIDRNARAQGQLIDDLLDVSQIISGKVRLKIDAVEPIYFIEMAIEAVRPAAEAKAIKLETTLDPNAGAVMGDVDRLQQVVWNLLTNAVKFTPKGGSVRVGLERRGSSVEVLVQDDGQGIRADFMPYVFERFRQADASFTRSRGGLGLGLAIVRHLVELHGGTIRADSAGDGRGATFTLTLPIAPMRRRSRTSDDGRAARGSTPPPSELDGLRILIVDDEPDGREMLMSMLEQCNAVVTVAGSAKEALEELRRTRPAILVSDVGMPGEDGYDLIRRVRSLPDDEGRQTPAIALTAYARREDRTQALRAGFDMHVAKPIDPAELVVVIAALYARLAR